MNVPLGSWDLVAPIARGGMGVVYRAIHRDSGTPGAVKVLTDTAAAHHVDALQAEVRAVAALHHPHIIWVHDVGTIDRRASERSLGLLPAGSPWFAMEMAEQGRLSLDRIVDFVALVDVLLPLLDALGHAHARGVIHRDIKPANVLFGGGGERDGLKLSDFGMVYALGQDSAMSGGTPTYMAPEQFAKRGVFGPWTDLYAVGCLAWGLTTGSRPFVADDWDAWAAVKGEGRLPRFEPRFTVPPGFEDWIRTLVQPAPANRPAFAADAARDLAALLGRTLPQDWRREDPRPSWLAGIGTSLYGLRTVPTVGRETERQRLWHALDGSGPRALVLRGPAGVGKSKLAGWLSRRATELGRAWSLVATHNRLPTPQDGLAPMLPRDLRRRRFSTARERHLAIVEWLASHDRPILLWIDDAPLGLDALQFTHVLLASEVDALVVLTARDDHLAEYPDADELLEDLPTIALAQLDSTELRGLLDVLLPLDEGLASGIEDRVGGNPLFAVQLVGDQVARGLRVRDGRFHSTERARLPADLAAVWRRKVDRVVGKRDDWRRALQLAAVLGLDVNSVEWRDAGRQLGLQVDATLVLQLAVHGLATVDPRSRGVKWRFAHGMLREAVLDGVDVRPLHAACAAIVHDDPGRFGRHLLGAGRLEEALEPLLDGAERLFGVNDYRGARRLAQAREDAAAALALPASDERWGLGWSFWESLHRVQGDYDTARDWLSRLQEASTRHGWRRAGFSALVAAMETCVDQGDVAGARGHADAVHALAASSGDRRRYARALHVLSVVHRVGSDLQTAERHARRSVDLYLEVGPERSAGFVWIELAIIALQDGRFDTALERCERGHALLESAGSRFGVAQCATLRAEVAKARRDLDAAEAAYTEARRTLVALQHQGAALAGINLGLVLAEKGRTAEAVDLLRPGLDAGKALHRRVAHLGLLVCSAGDASFDGHLAEVRAWLEGGVAEQDVAHTLELAGDRAAEAGRSHRALQAWQLARDQWGRLGRTADEDRVRHAMERQLGPGSSLD